MGAVNMLSKIVSLSLVVLTSGQWPAAVPLTPGNIPGLVPGSAAAAQWWNNLLIWQATQDPAGVSAAACPNYPFCNLAPIVPVGYVNTAGYPAGVSAAACPGYPYCSY